MGIFSTLGFGSKKLLSSGHRVAGTVTKVSTCWWLKINTKPVRTHAMDGAIFPHMVSYTYAVNGQSYSGKRIISAYAKAPSVHAPIQVYYDESKPAHSTIKV